MNAHHQPEPEFESHLRQRASRLAKPDAAWREVILGNVQDRLDISPHRTLPLWKTRWFPRTLAACWLFVSILNWCAERETRRFSQYANAQAVPIVMGGWDQPVLLAAASSR